MRSPLPWRPAPIRLTTAEWLPLQSIRGRTMELQQGLARLLEVGSIHRNLRSPGEERRLNLAEEEFWNSLRFPVQRLALPTPLDLGEYLAGMEAHAAADPEPDRGRVLSEKAEHVRGLVRDRHLVAWRNLLVVPWHGRPGDPEGEVMLAERVLHVRTGLERLGLPVRELEAAEIAQVWQVVLAGEPAPAVVVAGADPCLVRLDFSPRDHFRIGSRYARILAVTDYPRKVTPAKFADLYRLDRRVAVVQHIHPTESADLQRSISQSLGEIRGKLGMQISPQERETLRARERDAQRLLRKLAGENHNVLDFCLLLFLSAADRKELDTLTRAVRGRLEGKGMRAWLLTHLDQIDGLRAALPAAENPLRQAIRRNVPAESLPATFPYHNPELNMGRGIVRGINKATGNLVITDPYSLMNAHEVYISMAGSGKTFTLNLGLIQLWSRGVMIRSIDIEGDKGRLCHELQGQRVRISPYAGNCINPLQVRRPALDPTLYLESESEEPANGLAATIQRVLILLSLMLPDVTAVELARAEKLLIDVYEAAGVRFDAAFDRIPAAEWPTLHDLHAAFATDAALARLAAVLQTWTAGSLQGMIDRATNVNCDNQYVLLDLHDVMGHRLARQPIFFVAMTYLWDEINRDWRQEKVLDIDELGILADSEDALEFTWRIAKCARRRRCRLQIATQDPGDFLNGRNEACRKYAAGIINNCATKVLGYLEPKALDQVAQVVRLSEAELELLSRLPREEKLLICGEQRAHVEVVASPEELRILDPAQHARRGRRTG